MPRGNVLTSGTQTQLSAYNVVNRPTPPWSAQQDADKRAAQDIAERIRLDLGVFSGSTRNDRQKP
jgi:LPS-assembly lipoprotein